MSFDLESLVKSLNDSEGYERFDYSTIVSDISRPQFESTGKRVHDWRAYIPTQMMDAWDSLSLETRICLFLVADEVASREEWD